MLNILSIAPTFDQFGCIFWLVRGETKIQATQRWVQWLEVFDTRAEAARFAYTIKEIA